MAKKIFSYLCEFLVAFLFFASVLWVGLDMHLPRKTAHDETIPEKSEEATTSNSDPTINDAPHLEPLIIVKTAPATEPETAEGPELVELGEFKVTHYCSCPFCCGDWSDGVTASGSQVQQGRTIATDPDVIPIGSRVRIYYEDGTEQDYVAEDTGSAIQGNRIDVYMDSHEAALEEGVKIANVYIIKEE